MLNVLYIVCHDLGQHLNCYGQSTVRSPNLDRLAAEGVRLENAFCASPACSPSRGCFMSGRWAHQTGLTGLVNRGWNLDASVPTLVDWFRDAGYGTHLIGLQHERKDRAAHGYDYDWGSLPPRAENVADHIIDFLHSDHAQRPFFVNAGTFETHLPFNREQYPTHDPDAVEVPPFLPDRPEVRRELAAFHGSIEFLDAQIGRVLDALDETGLAERTLVVFAADHGMALPRAKGTLYDSGIEIAMLLRGPNLRKGAVVHEPVLNLDLTATLLEAAGIDRPSIIEGQSFYPALVGEAPGPRDHIVVERNFHRSNDPSRCVRTDRYKYIAHFGDEPHWEIPLDVQRAEPGALYADPATRPRRPRELYDLANDPHELHNLIDDPAYEKVRADLEQRLSDWQQRTDDPVLHGSVPQPAGTELPE